MNEDEKVFESLLLGGIIGASLANILKEDTTVGAIAIAGAVILATYRASEKAEKSKVPIIKVEKNRLFIIKPDGTKKYVKLLSEKSQKVPAKPTRAGTSSMQPL